MIKAGKFGMWIKRLIEIISFGRSKGWWKEKPTVPGLEPKP